MPRESLALRQHGHALLGVGGGHEPLGWLVPNGAMARIALARSYRCLCIGHEVAVFRTALQNASAAAAPLASAVRSGALVPLQLL